jgi:hypothetical protein
LQGLTLATFYKHYNLEHETRLSSHQHKAVPVTTKSGVIESLSDSVVVKYLQEYGFESIANEFLQIRAEIGNFNSEFELPNIVNKFYLSEQLNEWTTIQEAYGDKCDAIEALDNGQSEVAKVLRYILDKDIPIKKIYVATVGVKFIIFNGSRLQLSDSARKKYPQIKSGHFSVASSGKLSDECLIFRAWDDLVQQVPILNPKQCMSDFNQLQDSSLWSWGLVGCYLKKYLTIDRYAVSVFYFAKNQILFRTGTFDEQEDELIWERIKNNDGPYNLDELSSALTRQKHEIASRIERLKRNETKSQKRAHYTLKEDHMILQGLFGQPKPIFLEDIINMKSKNLHLLEKEINRSRESIQNRWRYNIKPCLLAHLHGRIENDSLDILKYLMNSKAISISNIDWSSVIENFPYCSRQAITNMLRSGMFTRDHGLPLFERISKNIHKYKSGSTPSAEKRKQDLLEVFDDFRGVTPMSTTTRLKLSQ